MDGIWIIDTRLQTYSFCNIENKLTYFKKMSAILSRS